ncbi:MAG: DUF3078 domain-containing protein [Flavobacteriaceae bacterium]|nr:DUF3078 domain-containing protein [Flavobacteriaceae bacterium]
MGRLIVFFTLITFNFSIAQINEVAKEIKRIQFQLPDTIMGWERDGNLRLNFNQAFYENWQSGESNTIELNAHISHDFNYQKNKIIWDNKLLFDYGLSKINGYDIRKTQDKLEINSVIGGKSANRWSYSFFVNLQTPVSNTYNYDKDLKRDNRTAGFLAPLYMAAGPGIMWRKDANLHLNIAPVTAKSVYINGWVNRFNTQLDRFENNNEREIYGVLPGEQFRHKLGFYSSAYMKLDLMKNVKMENRLSIYSNFLEEPENIDFDYTMNLILKINDLLSTSIVIQTRYDDKEYEGLQLRETFGIGLNFKI